MFKIYYVEGRFRAQEIDMLDSIKLDIPFLTTKLPLPCEQRYLTPIARNLTDPTSSGRFKDLLK